VQDIFWPYSVTGEIKKYFFISFEINEVFS